MWGAGGGGEDYGEADGEADSEDDGEDAGEDDDEGPTFLVSARGNFAPPNQK